MNHQKLTTPVLFLIFNRPDKTQRVFNAMRNAKPTKLFVAADGPRNNKDVDAEKCQAARDVVKEIITVIDDLKIGPLVDNIGLCTGDVVILYYSQSPADGKRFSANGRNP